MWVTFSQTPWLWQYSTNTMDRPIQEAWCGRILNLGSLHFVKIRGNESTFCYSTVRVKHYMHGSESSTAQACNVYYEQYEAGALCTAPLMLAALKSMHVPSGSMTEPTYRKLPPENKMRQWKLFWLLALCGYCLCIIICYRPILARGIWTNSRILCCDWPLVVSVGGCWYFGAHHINRINT